MKHTHRISRHTIPAGQFRAIEQGTPVRYMGPGRDPDDQTSRIWWRDDRGVTREGEVLTEMLVDLAQLDLLGGAA